jgi:prepilin-type N-terminal cleavage/methylation domain-containing protein
MSTDSGFTLVETLVAALIGAILVVSIGVLGGTLLRHRANADSISAATSVAEAEIERLRALGEPPDGTVGWNGVNEAGEPDFGPYEMQTVVEDDQPPLDPDALSKRLTVRVRHQNNPLVSAEVTTYLQYAQATLSGGGAGTPTPTPTAGDTPTPAPTSTPTPTSTPRPGGGGGR